MCIIHTMPETKLLRVDLSFPRMRFLFMWQAQAFGLFHM